MEPELVSVYDGLLRVYEYKGYVIFVGILPEFRGDKPISGSYYPSVSLWREGGFEELVTPTLTYTAQRRCNSIEDASALGSKLGKEAIDEIADDATSPPGKE